MPDIPALGLIRVSTSRQAEHGYSPDEQRAAIAQFATSHGLRVIEYVEEHKSGRTADRKDIRRMRELAKQHKIKAVVAFVMDRLSRSLEIQIALRKEIKSLGLELYTTTRGRIEDAPEDNLMSNIEGAFSQHEIEIFARRSRMGRAGKAKSGKWVGTGKPPYGYTRHGLRGDVRLEINTDEARIVRRIYDLYTVDRHGIRAISESLNADRIAGPTGGLWWWSTVKRILSMRCYIGEFQYMDVTIHLPRLAIIERAQFEQARRLRVTNRETARRNKKHDYLFSNHIFCNCGRKMFGEDGDHYVCTSRNLPKPLRGCTYGKVYESNILPVVWQYLRAELSDERLQIGIDEAAARAARPRQPDRFAEIDAEIARHQRKAALLLERFGDDSQMTALIDAQIRAEAGAIDRLQQERDALAVEQQDRQIDMAARANVIANVAMLRHMLDDPDRGVQARVIDALRVTVALGSTRGGERTITVTDVFGKSRAMKIRHNPGR